MKTEKFTLTVLLLAMLAAGVSSRITGTVYAYDPIMHLVRHTHAENVDIVILKTSKGQPHEYVKVMIRSLGQTLSEFSYRGGEAVQLSVVRDKSCDEATVDIVPRGSVPTESGHYILSATYENETPAKLSNLPCYVARMKVR